MTQPASNLLSEFQWDGLTARNRIALSPMTRGRAGETMTAHSMMARYYAQRASSGIIIKDIREVDHGRLMANCGYDRDQAEEAINARSVGQQSQLELPGAANHLSRNQYQ